GVGCCCTPAGVGVGVALPPLQTGVTNPSRHSVFSFHFFSKSFRKASSDFCWFCDCSVWRMVSFACSSVCCEALVTFSTSKTYQPNCVLTGPVILPLSAP